MSKIISLDGDWQMIWDTEDTGISNRWYATYPEKTQTVSVPHIWERAFDKLLMAQDCAFYFKRFTIDDEKQVTKRIFLRFEKIATHATIWLNGNFASALQTWVQRTAASTSVAKAKKAQTTATPTREKCRLASPGRSIRMAVSAVTWT